MKKEDLEHPEAVRNRQSGDAPLQASEGNEGEQRDGRQIDPRMVQTHLPAGYGLQVKIEQFENLRILVAGTSIPRRVSLSSRNKAMFMP